MTHVVAMADALESASAALKLPSGARTDWLQKTKALELASLTMSPQLWRWSRTVELAEIDSRRMGRNCDAGIALLQKNGTMESARPKLESTGLVLESLCCKECCVGVHKS